MVVPQTEIIVTKDGVEVARRIVPPGEYVLGRGRDTDLQVDTPLASRHHARITVNYDEWLVEDLGSANGTFINDEPVAANETVRLYPTQRLRVGDSTVTLRRLQIEAGPDASLAPGVAAGRELLPEAVRTRRYAIGKTIAQGGMGAILSAEDQSIRRAVAMKVMLQGSDAVDLGRFVEEAQITGQLEHPNIVPVHELGVDEQEQFFYTMKLVKGITLRKVLELLAEGVAGTVVKYPLGNLLTVFQKVCDAMAFAHSRKVIHRDIKPENVMIGDFGEVLLMDWGLAKMIGSAEKLGGVHTAKSDAGGIGSTMAGAVLGTPQYMAPEQARGEVATMDQRADIYALGGILYHMLALKPAVTGTGAWEIVEKVAKGEIEPLVSTKAREIPDSLAAVARKAMALEPGARYASVPELQADIEAFQNGFATSAEHAGALKQAALFFRRNMAASIGAAAAIFLAGTLGTQAVIAGRSAKKALKTLKATAPDLVRLAATDANAQDYAASEKNLAAARSLDPELDGIYWQHTWNLLGMGDYAAAATAFREALARDPSRKDRARFLQYIEQLAAATTPAEKADTGALSQLAKLMRENGATGPAGVLLGKVGGNAAARVALVQERVGKLMAREHFTASASPTGSVSLSLRGGVTDLEMARGVPIDGLETLNGRMTSLEPLRGMRLTRLVISLTPVTDLSPLEGMAISNLNIHGTKVNDLRPLKGMPLSYLAASATEVVDLEPLRGAPLTTLSMYGSKIADLGPLAGAPLREVVLNGTRISSIKALTGAPIQTLDISATQVTDLTPLRGMPLVSLKINGLTQLTDLGPLRGLSLKSLVIDNNKRITDFTPLLDLAQLESISCVNVPAALPTLRKMPSLRVITYRLPGDAAVRDRPATEFWKDYDAQAGTPPP